MRGRIPGKLLSCLVIIGFLGSVFFLPVVTEAASYIKLTPNGNGGYNYQVINGSSGGSTSSGNSVSIKSPSAPVTKSPTVTCPGVANPAPANPVNPSNPGNTQPTNPGSGNNTGTQPAAGLTAGEQQLINLVNQERAANGLSALQVDMQLVQLARLKSKDMIDKNYFSHTSPTYGTPGQMLANAGVKYRGMGENIAGNRSVQGAHTSLMNSSGHRANILNRNFTHVGIGVVSGGPYGMMITQIFITK